MFPHRLFCCCQATLSVLTANFYVDRILRKSPAPLVRTSTYPIVSKTYNLYIDDMTKWRALAILFTLLTFGALQETYRIFTSSAPDIASNRRELMVMSVIITAIVIFFTIRFWNKASDKKMYWSRLLLTQRAFLLPDLKSFFSSILPGRIFFPPSLHKSQEICYFRATNLSVSYYSTNPRQLFPLKTVNVIY